MESDARTTYRNYGKGVLSGIALESLSRSALWRRKNRLFWKGFGT